MPSSTVENYLKAIYIGTNSLEPPQRLLPMGQLASALNVTPGTATTMVKTLADSGLVEYEPYAGVALTEAGQKLAALVTRRHRLIELFLVQVMGYAWDEVHDEAEQLEHTVSDRLVDRMDAMLGRPEADPHGDPIPNAEGLVKPQKAQTLLTCPMDTTLTVTRVIDQDKDFLRFIEHHNLKPGEAIAVEERDRGGRQRARAQQQRRTADDWDAGRVQSARASRSCAASRAAERPGLRQATTRTARTAAHGALRLHGLSLQQARSSATRDSTSTVSSCSSPTASRDRIRFVGELELEHAVVEGLEEKGELELEQAYVDFLLSRSFNVRAGMMLMPIGIINERHEPPVYYGVERPFVDTVIIPTTWFEAGAGVHGEIGRGWRYRAFVMAPLDAVEFTRRRRHSRGTAEGLRSQRRASRRSPDGSSTSRIRGLTLGASGWSGHSGFQFRPRFDVPVSLAEFDAPLLARPPRAARTVRAGLDRQRRATERRARRFASASTRISRSALRGFYGEAGYRRFRAPSFGEVGAFVRYENFDTQFRMPAGYVALQEFDRDAWVVGANYWPDPDIAVKFDYSIVRSRSTVDSSTRTRSTSAWDGGSDAIRLHVAGSALPLAHRSTARTVARRRLRPGTGRAGRRDHRRAFQLQPVGDSRQGRHDARDSAHQRRHDARLPHPRHRHRPRAAQARPRRDLGHVPADGRPLHVRVLADVRRRAHSSCAASSSPSDGQRGSACRSETSVDRGGVCALSRSRCSSRQHRCGGYPAIRCLA